MDFFWGLRIGHLLEKFPQLAHGFVCSIEVQCHGSARIPGWDDRSGNIVRQKVQNFWEGMGLCLIEKPDRVRTGLLVARVSILFNFNCYLQTMLGLSLAKSKHALRCFIRFAASPTLASPLSIVVGVAGDAVGSV
jgi:hypothetical protein